MGKVTYGIRFSKTSPLSEEIKTQKRKLKVQMLRKNTRQACKVALGIADLYFSQTDYIDTDLPEADQERDKIEYTNESLKLCEKCLPVYIKYEDYEQLSRCYIMMIRCYQRLKNHQEALATSEKLLELFKEPNPKYKDKAVMQQTYKLLGEIHFTHGLLGDDSSKLDDLPLAFKFYQKERKILDSVKAHNLKDDAVASFVNNMRASDFNLGVILVKLAYSHNSSSEWTRQQDGETAEHYLKNAIQGCIKLDDAESERETYWELGNLYSKQGRLELALECRKKELDLVQKNELSNELSTMIDTIKTLVQMENYPDCMEFCRKMRYYVQKVYADDMDELKEQDDLVQETINMVDTVRVRRQELEQLIRLATEEHSKYNKENNIDIVEGYKNMDDPSVRNAIIGGKMRRQIGTVSLSLGELLKDTDLRGSSQQVVDKGLSYVMDANTDDNDFEINVSAPLMLLRINLLEIKADNHWKLHDLPKDKLIKMNQTIINLATTHIKTQQVQFEILIPVLKRNRDIYQYFGEYQEEDRWRRLARRTEEEYNALTGQHDSEDDPDDEIMRDSSITDEEDMDIDQDPIPLMLHPKPLFGTEQTPAKMPITVAINLKNIPRKMVIICDDDMETLEWLEPLVIKKSWELYGIEPILSHFRHNNDDLFPDDTFNELAAGHNELTLDAIVKGYKEKSLLDLYENVCSRLGKSPLPRVRRSFNDKPFNTGHLTLRGTGLSSLEIDPIIELVKLLPSPLSSIDLSANLLDDHDIIKLFDAIPCPPDLNLSSNLLTLDSLKYIYEKHGNLMESVEFAYNFLGPSVQQHIKDIYHACPKLRHLNIEGSDICFAPSPSAPAAEVTVPVASVAS